MTQILAGICCFFAMFVANPAQTDLANRSFTLGNEAARNGRYEEAIEKYREAIINVGPYGQNDIFLARNYSNIGVCQYRLDRFEEAVSSLNTAVRLSNGRYAHAHYALGMTYISMGRTAEAEKSLLKSLRLETQDGEAWFDLAVVMLLKKDVQAVEKAFERSIRFGTRASAQAHNDLGVLLAGRGRWSDAVKHFSAAVESSRGTLSEAVRNLEISKRSLAGEEPLMASLTTTSRVMKRN